MVIAKVYEIRSECFKVLWLYLHTGIENLLVAWSGLHPSSPFWIKS